MTAQPEQIERSKIDPAPLREAKLPIIFVIGGPGCGKGTQCERIVATYGFTHLSTGDLLRDEVKSGSKRGQSLQNIMKRGDLVPLDIVLDLLMETMIKALPNSKGFLIDGYPREIDQGIQFEKQIKPCSALLYFEATDATMMERLLKRAQTSGRADDNEETIKKRLQTFHNVSKPVVDHYKTKVKTFCGEKPPDEIFVEVSAYLDAVNKKEA